MTAAAGICSTGPLATVAGRRWGDRSNVGVNAKATRVGTTVSMIFDEFARILVESCTVISVPTHPYSFSDLSVL